MADINRIYAGDDIGYQIHRGCVGTKEIKRMSVVRQDYIYSDERTAVGLVGRTATGALIGGLLAGPLGQLVGVGLAANSWDKKKNLRGIQVYDIEVEYGNGCKGRAWVDQDTLRWFRDNFNLK